MTAGQLRVSQHPAEDLEGVCRAVMLLGAKTCRGDEGPPRDAYWLGPGEAAARAQVQQSV